MTFVEKMRIKYPKQHYTMDDVANEIMQHISATYEEVAKNNFLEWPGFNFDINGSVPQMEWNVDKGIHWLLLPEDCGVTFEDVSNWFRTQEFEYCSTDSNKWAWRIKF